MIVYLAQCYILVREAWYATREGKYGVLLFSKVWLCKNQTLLHLYRFN
jgi:hypothetical protein